MPITLADRIEFGPIDTVRVASTSPQGIPCARSRPHSRPACWRTHQPGGLPFAGSVAARWPPPPSPADPIRRAWPARPRRGPGGIVQFLRVQAGEQRARRVRWRIGPSGDGHRVPGVGRHGAPLRAPRRRRAAIAPLASQRRRGPLRYVRDRHGRSSPPAANTPPSTSGLAASASSPGDYHYVHNPGSETLRVLAAFTHEIPTQFTAGDVVGIVPGPILAQVLGVDSTDIPDIPGVASRAVVPCRKRRRLRPSTRPPLRRSPIPSTLTGSSRSPTRAVR